MHNLLLETNNLHHSTNQQENKYKNKKYFQVELMNFNCFGNYILLNLKNPSI